MEFKTIQICIASMTMGKKIICMLVEAMLRGREQKNPGFLLASQTSGPRSNMNRK